MNFDKIMDFKEAKAIIKEIGFEGFTEMLDNEFGYEFFGCSTYWYDANDSKYICKLKGRKGDIIIGWKGIHDAA